MWVQDVEAVNDHIVHMFMIHRHDLGYMVMSTRQILAHSVLSPGVYAMERF